MTRTKSRSKTIVRKTTAAQAAKFARLCITNTPEGMEAARTFSKMYLRAFREGRLLTPERVAVLYPVLAEINAEIDQTAQREVRSR